MQLWGTSDELAGIPKRRFAECSNWGMISASKAQGRVMKYRRSLAVTKILEAGDVDRFMAEIETDITKEKSNAYKNNQSASFMGR